jgi:hypothetical protein
LFYIRVSKNTEQIVAVQLSQEGLIEYKIENAQLSSNLGVYKEPPQWFYESSNMVIKAGLTNTLAKKYGLTLLAKAGYYMVGNIYHSDFFGRVFSIVKTLPFSKALLKQYLKENNMYKANLAAKNFVSGVDELRKTFMIQDGGEDYLFFTLNANNEKVFFHCVKP